MCQTRNIHFRFIHRRCRWSDTRFILAQHCSKQCEEGAFSSSGDLIRPQKERVPRNGLAILLGTAAESLFATLFPGNCRFCDSPLIRVSRVPVCDACLEDVRGLPADQLVCDICGERLLRPADRAELFNGVTKCAACREHRPAYETAVCYGEYDGALRELIHLLKYEGVKPAASVLGRMIGEIVVELKPRFEQDTPLVIPVPLHGSKLRARGFNQSEMIARAAVRAAGLRSQVNTTALERIRDTGSQTGMTRPQRQENMRGAFAVTHPDQVAGREILLVDDVFTTGATVSECARMLKKSGAKKIFVATVARVLLPDRTALDPKLEAAELQKFAEEAMDKPMTRAAHA
jgi:ComF family protein